jgi:transcription elongation factor SPT6
MILDDAFFNFLLPVPSMEKEALSLLMTKAKYWLYMEYGKQLLNKVIVAPWKKMQTRRMKDVESELRVMVFCWGLGKPTTTFVMLERCR